MFAQNADRLNWDLSRSPVNKANGHVVVAGRHVATLRKEDDDAHARAKANANGGTEAQQWKLNPRQCTVRTQIMLNSRCADD